MKVTKLFASPIVRLLCYSIFQLLVSLPLMDFLQRDSFIWISYLDKFMLPAHRLWFDIWHTSRWNCSSLHFTTCLWIWQGLGNAMDSSILNHLMETKLEKQEKPSIEFLSLHEFSVIASKISKLAMKLNCESTFHTWIWLMYMDFLFYFMVRLYFFF